MLDLESLKDISEQEYFNYFTPEKKLDDCIKKYQSKKVATSKTSNDIQNIILNFKKSIQERVNTYDKHFLKVLFRRRMDRLLNLTSQDVVNATYDFNDYFIAQLREHQEQIKNKLENFKRLFPETDDLLFVFNNSFKEFYVQFSEDSNFRDELFEREFNEKHPTLEFQIIGEKYELRLSLLTHKLVEYHNHSDAVLRFCFAYNTKILFTAWLKTHNSLPHTVYFETEIAQRNNRITDLKFRLSEARPANYEANMRSLNLFTLERDVLLELGQQLTSHLQKDIDYDHQNKTEQNDVSDNNSIDSINDKSSVETSKIDIHEESNLETKKLDNLEKCRQRILEGFDSLDTTKKWTYAFHEESDLNEFVNLLVNHFNDLDVIIPSEIFVRNGCKTKLAKILRGIYINENRKKLSFKANHNFFELLKVLNVFSDLSNDALYTMCLKK